MLDPELEKISRKLCQILRHQIVDLHLKCDEMGFVKVSDLLKKIQHVSIEQIKSIVITNDKKRFELIEKNGECWMRAVQGHNRVVGDLLNANEAFDRITEALPFCAHGTEKQYTESILNNGLNRMGRKHIHLVSQINASQQLSGYKKKSNMIVMMDMQKCMDDGMVFYRSANNVILTEGIDGIIHPKYIKNIVPISVFTSAFMANV